MIQVLCRAFTLLEWMSDSPRQPRGMSELARKIGVQSATCSHIVKTLVEQGYLRKLDGKRGYILGPMVYYLARKGPYRKDLVDIAEPLLREYAKKTGETVLLSVIQGTKRFILCQAEGGHALRVNTDILYLDDVYHTATGRLLIAYMNDSDLKIFLRSKGLPGEDYWPGASSEGGFRAATEAIRSDGYVQRRCGEDIMQIAYPVFEGDNVVAAVGSFIPLYRFKGKHKQLIVRELEKIASVVNNSVAAGKQVEGSGA